MNQIPIVTSVEITKNNPPLIGGLIFLLFSISLIYIVTNLIWLNNLEATTIKSKKEYLKYLLIPFYGWYIVVKIKIKDLIEKQRKIYKELAND